MPLQQRLIEPLYICRDILTPELLARNPVLYRTQLEYMANGSLANVIRQLSSLAFHADDVFNGILDESRRLSKKTEYLQHRIDQLAGKVTSLDFQQEQVAFTDLNCSELFKSSVNYDQEVLSRQTMPAALARKYTMCDKAPPLHLLNPYREDGKDATKFYTDPNFFFDLWKDQMLKETEKEKFSKKMISNSSLNKQMQQIEESHTNKKSKKPRKPENSTEKYRKLMSQQEFFVDSNQIPVSQQRPGSDYSPYGTIEAITTANRDLDVSRKANQSQVDGRLNFTENRPTHFRLNDPNSASILPTAQLPQKENTNHVRFNQTPEIIPRSPVLIKSDSPVPNSSAGGANSAPQNFAIPPPPPMPGQLIYNNSSSSLNKSTTNGGAKMPAVSGAQATSLAQEIASKKQELKSAPLNPLKPLSQHDARSTLLASIREGIKLRSVQQRQQKQVEKQNSAHLKDVASILARRVAMQLSDSESNHSNAESEDDDWVNDN